MLSLKRGDEQGKKNDFLFFSTRSFALGSFTLLKRAIGVLFSHVEHIVYSSQISQIEVSATVTVQAGKGEGEGEGAGPLCVLPGLQAVLPCRYNRSFNGRKFEN